MKVYLFDYWIDQPQVTKLRFDFKAKEYVSVPDNRFGRFLGIINIPKFAPEIYLPTRIRINRDTGETGMAKTKLILLRIHEDGKPMYKFDCPIEEILFLKNKS